MENGPILLSLIGRFRIPGFPFPVLHSFFNTPLQERGPIGPLSNGRHRAPEGLGIVRGDGTALLLEADQKSLLRHPAAWLTNARIPA